MASGEPVRLRPPAEVNEAPDNEPPSSYFLLWGVPLGFFCLFSTEVAQLHEFILPRLDVFLRYAKSTTGVTVKTLGLRTLLIWTPVWLTTGWVARRIWSGCALPPGCFIRFLIGLAVLFGSAAGLETLSLVVPHIRGWEIAQVFGEEMGEMIGGTLLIWVSRDVLIDALDPRRAQLVEHSAAIVSPLRGRLHTA